MKKFIEFKKKWSAKIVTFAEDTQKHMMVVFALMALPTTVGMFNEIPELARYALYWNITIFIGCIVWELLGFIEKGFTKETKLDAIRDLAAAFGTLFLPCLWLLIKSTS